MKTFCVLQVAAKKPNWDHVKMFSNKPDCDFFFVTWKEKHEAALAFCPNSSWAETRNKLVELVPKQYEYYAFIDEDYILGTHTNLDPRQQIAADLAFFKPAVLIPYPGKGNATPLVQDEKYRQSVDYSVHLFTHCGLKIVHRSLLPWFFPMLTEFDGWWSASHFWNIQEIPFMEHIVVSHRLTYQNGANSSAEDNQKIQKRLNMDKMWCWLRPYFNKRHLLRNNWPKGVPKDINEHATATDAMAVKKYYVEYCAKQGLRPRKKESQQDDYYDLHLLTRFFDLPFTRQRSKPLVVVGNGPSRQADCFSLITKHGLDSIGMNGEYRKYREIGWYPTYFCGYDYAVTESQAKDWAKMVLDPKVPISKYFLLERPSIEAKLGHTRPYFPDKVREHPKFVEIPHNQDGIGWPEFGVKNRKMSSTGVGATRLGAMLGYKRILLIGCDCRYQVVEKSAAKAETDQRLRVTDGAQRAQNHFWADYYQPGDLLHRPGDQLPAWRRLAELLKKYAPDVEVINCTPRSRVDCFSRGIFDREVTGNV